MYLSARGIQYEDRDVASDPQAVFELVRTYGSHTTPTFVIGDDVVIGFRPAELDRLLDAEA
jgi:glutaredoxin